MDLIESFIRNPVKVSVGVILVAMFGGLAIWDMPKQLTPDVEAPTITVETRWRGASPQEVEREIIQEQEEQLKTVEGVTRMNSESRDSVGQITLEFNATADMSEALVKVNAKLQQVREYPLDADEPVITTSNLSDRPIAWFILLPKTPSNEELTTFAAKYADLAPQVRPVMEATNNGLRLHRLRALWRDHAGDRARLAAIMPEPINVPKLRRFAEDVIEARLERVDGISGANVVGGQDEELQVVIDPQKLASRQLTIIDVRAALQAENQDTSSGDFWEGKRRWVVRTLGQFRSQEQVANVILARRDGAPVYVRDVATVRTGHKKPDGLTRRFGTLSLAVNCSRERGSNVLEVMEKIRVAADQLNRTVLRPRGLELEQVYDETEYIYSAIGVVTENILAGAVMTFLTLLIFLRSARSTVIIGIHILISTIGAFLLMRICGRSLNVPSLGGLAFAVGMLVDNAIVMLENIYRRHQSGESPMTASVRGAKEVWGALLNASVVNLAVFLPVVFMKEEAGQLFRDIALAISGSVGLSLIVAITVVPTSAMRLLRPAGAETTHAPSAWRRLLRTPLRLLHAVLLHPLDVMGAWFVRLVVGINARLQRSPLTRLATILAFVGISSLLTWLMLPKVEYLPNGNRNLVICILVPPSGYNIDQMIQMGRQIESDLEPYWAVDPKSPAAKDLPYPAIADFFYVARGRTLFIGLRAADPLRAPELVNLIRSVTQSFPGTIARASQASLFESGLTAGRTVDVEITGPDVTRLVKIGAQVMQRVTQVIPGAQPLPRPSLDLNSPEVHVIPKWEQAADMRVSSTDLGYMVDALVDGAYASDYYIGGDKIDLMIVGRNAEAEEGQPSSEEQEPGADFAGFRARTQDLASLAVAVPTGEVVQLAALADVQLSSGPEQINHRETQRAVTIGVTPPPDVPLERAMELIASEIVAPLTASGALEGGRYQITLGGTADKLRDTWRSLRFNLLLAMVITYLLMAALFESWLYPFVVITSVPLGAVGGFAGLWVLNQWVLQPMDVLTMLGFVILVGTVVNNPILIVEQALIHMREEGMPQREAILQSVRTRIRPIFMTTLGGLIGLLPLVVSPGAGSELYRGIGSVLLGGMLVSTVFTLILVPSLFSLMLELKALVLGKPAVRDVQPEPAGHEPGFEPHSNGQPGDAPVQVPQPASALRVT